MHFFHPARKKDLDDTVAIHPTSAEGAFVAFCSNFTLFSFIFPPFFPPSSAVPGGWRPSVYFFTIFCPDFQRRSFPSHSSRSGPIDTTIFLPLSHICLGRSLMLISLLLDFVLRARHSPLGSVCRDSYPVLLASTSGKLHSACLGSRFKLILEVNKAYVC
jgi:hypothetical protein